MKRRSSVLRSAAWTGFFVVAVPGLPLASGHISPLLTAQENTHAEIESGKIDSTASETAAEPAEEEESKERTKKSRLDCRNPEVLKWSKEEEADNTDIGETRQRPPVKPFLFDELSLSKDKKKFEAGGHADTACVDRGSNLHTEELRP
jgi:hypothetical protein